MSTLTVSLVQTPLFWEDKEANLDMLGKKVLDIKERTEVVVLPEMFSTGFTMNAAGFAESMTGPTMSWMKQLAIEKKCILTGSLIIKESRNDQAVFFNRLVWMQPDGSYGYYDKRHLFAYGKEDLHYTPGARRLISSVNGWKVNLQVCYDLRFPVWLRQSNPASNSVPENNRPEYDLLIIVANWPTTRIHAWKTLLSARAIENQCFVAGVNRIGTDRNGLAYPGESAVYGPLGETLQNAGSEESIITLTLNSEQTETARKQFPFWKDADHFLIQS